MFRAADKRRVDRVVSRQGRRVGVCLEMSNEEREESDRRVTPVRGRGVPPGGLDSDSCVATLQSRSACGDRCEQLRYSLSVL